MRVIHLLSIVAAGFAVYASKSHGPSVCQFRQQIVWIAHALNVSDCKYNNIMADPLPLYDSPPHPYEIIMRRDFSGKVKVCSTRTQTLIKYYFVDFGLSRHYDPEAGLPLELPPWGGDNSVPEFLATDTPCDPFPVDVYCLGNAVREYFLGVRFFFIIIMLFPILF